MDGGAELVVIGLGLGCQSHVHDRLGELDRGELGGIADSGQGVAGLRVLELGQRHDVARAGFGQRSLFLADDLQYGGDGLFRVGRIVLDRHAGRERAGDDADVVELAEEGVDRRAPDLRHKRAVRVCSDFRPFGALENAASGARQNAAHAVEHLADADAFERQHGVNRVHRARTDAIFQAGADLFGGERALGEELLHERVVAFGGGFRQAVVEFGQLVGQMLFDEDVDHFFGGERRGDRHTVYTEGVAYRGEGFFEAGVLLVEAGDHERGGREAALFAGFPGAARSDLYAGDGIDCDQGEISCAHGSQYLAVEIHEAGGIGENQLILLIGQFVISR